MKKLLVLLVLLVSCKPTKTITTTTEKVRVDTIRDYKVITKYNAVHDTLTIDNPCDSSGILTNFYSKIKLPQGKVIIRSVQGKIQATIDIDSIANVYDSKYKSKYNSEVKLYEKVVVKNVVPMWAIITIFFESLIIIGYLYFRFINPFK